MIQVSVSEAQDRFPELLVAARAGEVVEIQQNGCTFRLTAVSSRPQPSATGVPKAGRLKGKRGVPDDFDEPIEDWLDATFLRYLETQADESVTLEQVRSALAKIPGSMVEDFRRERDERS